MLTYPQIDPIALKLGPIAVHWYGIMYLIGFVLTWSLGVYRSKKPWSVVKPDQVADAIFYGALGVILGGRTGYMLFYDFIPFIHQPWTILEVWDGGMSFHGGLIGVILAMWYYSRKININVFDLTDFFAPMVPIGLGLGRIGNFINGELWGRVTTSPIGMIFPTGGPWPRYPSQLIELCLEGITLFIILWTTSIKPRPRMLISALFLLLYSSFRFSAEFFRQPDPQLGFIAFGWLTMGQLLCVPMFLLGVGLCVHVILGRR
ncbi:MAG: prolipoprotein diacylglyceryl transferase [Gammaproteobacteria bacterium]|nr:prolipoprotein diacylglyceryl transferase [Gammaproteobacteria bacterium]